MKDLHFYHKSKEKQWVSYIDRDFERYRDVGVSLFEIVREILINRRNLRLARGNVIWRQSLLREGNVIRLLQQHVPIGAQVIRIPKRIQRNSSQKTCGP